MTNGQLMDYCRNKVKSDGCVFKCDDCEHITECNGFTAKYGNEPGIFYLKYAYNDNGELGKAFDIWDDDAFDFELGEFVAFEWNDINVLKIGWIERILDDGVFIKYERGNSAFIPFDKIHKIFNQSIIKETEIDEDFISD